MRKIPIIMSAIAALIVTGASPSLAQYASTLGTSTTNPPPGGSLTMSGDGFAPHTKVTITLESSPVLLGTAATNAGGAFSKTVTIPRTTAPGRHTIKATGKAAGGGTLVLSREIIVGGSLSGTGANILAWLVLGGGFLGLGLALLIARHRRSGSRPLDI